jgi:hypothetical protein
MRRRLSDQGFVALTVCLPFDDDPDKAKSVANATKFLKDNKVDLTNFLLDENEAYWYKKLGEPQFPCMYVFNRAGQIEEKLERKPDAKFEELIDRLLKEKAP